MPGKADILLLVVEIGVVQVYQTTRQQLCAALHTTHCGSMSATAFAFFFIGMLKRQGPMPMFIETTSNCSCLPFIAYGPLNVKKAKGPRNTPFSKSSLVPSNFCTHHQVAAAAHGQTSVHAL
eukprot:GHRR01013298.1.p3 GENE.GHRR01013298.1~~GHRR01013298.1.p3  ORF type:complete len:122 (+),score=31.01 GHRR01013298.1:1167-1532(+)